MGFLTEVTPDGLTAALDAVNQDSALIEDRLTLSTWASRPLEIPAGLEALLRYAGCQFVLV